MQAKLAAIMLSAIFTAGLTGCAKKEQTQTTAPASTDQSAQQSNPANPPATTTTTPAAQQAQPMASTPAAPAEPAPMAEKKEAAPVPPLVIPAGTSLVVRVGNTISTKTAAPGQAFTGTLVRPVTVHGVTAIPSGTSVSGTVVEAKSPGKFKGEGVLAIRLNSIDLRGGPIEIATSTYTQTIKGKGKRTAVVAGGGTAVGALIGGLAGGGKGAAIGALAGAGAGTAGAAYTGNKELMIPAETAVTFRLASPVTIRRSGARAQEATPAYQP